MHAFRRNFMHGFHTNADAFSRNQGEGREGVETPIHRAGPSVMLESESGLGRLGTKIKYFKDGGRWF